MMEEAQNIDRFNAVSAEQTTHRRHADECHAGVRHVIDNNQSITMSLIGGRTRSRAPLLKTCLPCCIDHPRGITTALQLENIPRSTDRSVNLVHRSRSSHEPSFTSIQAVIPFLWHSKPTFLTIAYSPAWLRGIPSVSA